MVLFSILYCPWQYFILYNFITYNFYMHTQQSGPPINGMSYIAHKTLSPTTETVDSW